MAIVAESTWAGWYRPRDGRWEKLVSDAESFEDAWGELLQAIQRRPPGDTIVLAGLRHPDDGGRRPFQAGGRRMV